MTLAPILVEALSHRYGDRVALDGVSFDVPEGVIFALLGPNGGGKTTLFRVLCTSMRPTAGRAAVCGHDVLAEAEAARRVIGVAFQSPSLDAKLTVRENMTHQGHLYGLSGGDLSKRIDDLLSRFGLADRARDRVETLSGGLARRVDLAKALIHRPKVLLLDEPSTGLDPRVRWDLWKYLDACRRDESVTVLMTTHFMDEADRCDRVAILDAGRLVALGPPETLKSGIAGDCLNLRAAEPQALADRIRDRFDVTPAVLNGTDRIERERGHELIPRLVEAFGETIESLSLSKPTLEEVFIHHTGHRFEEAEPTDG